MQIPVVDYHMHTPLCGHAEGQPEEYARQAIEVGLIEIGFSDHAPLLSHDDPSITMNIDQLPLYHQMMERVKKQNSVLKIKVGIEADYLPGFEKQTQALLEDYAYDYVIGSVHFIKAWGFDNPEQQAEWKKKDIDAVYQDYFILLRKCAQSRLFDIIGHVDLVKKFGHRPQKDLRQVVEETARVFKDSGVAIEINTAGLRKPVGEIYPSLWMLKIFCAAKVPLTFGSDAHEPKDVGRDFDKAYQLAKEAGYKEYLTFQRRKVAQIYGIE